MLSFHLESHLCSLFLKMTNVSRLAKKEIISASKNAVVCNEFKNNKPKIKPPKKVNFGLSFKKDWVVYPLH